MEKVAHQPCADGVPCTEAEHQLNRRSMFIIENYQILSGGTYRLNRPTQANSQVPMPNVNTPTIPAMPSPIQCYRVEVQYTNPTRPRQLYHQSG